MSLGRNTLERFLTRLLRRSELGPQEQRAIRSLNGETKVYRGRSDIVSPGEIVSHSCLVADGLVGRFDQMGDGQRQITAFYIAGDMCDLHSVVAPKTSWSITAISHSTILLVPHDELRTIAVSHPAIALAFWRDTTVDASILAKWVGNLGRKGGAARLAHVVCEMGMRNEFAGLGARNAFKLNTTQEQLADAAGMTPVHLNRMLQELRGRELLSFKSGDVEIPDWDRLASLAEFDQSYLMQDCPAVIDLSGEGAATD